MKFEWDKNKNEKNIEKHGIDFHDAEEVFNNPMLVKEDKRRDYGEKRYIALGLLRKFVVVVVYTIRVAVIRIISIRKANKKERNTYYERFQ